MVKYVQASYEILTPLSTDMLKLIELAGRTCYKSEDLITDESASSFVRMLAENKHESVIEHCSVTVKFIVNRGFTHELVRHRIASYSQESTRYTDYCRGIFEGQITVIDQRDLIAFQMTCDQRTDMNAILVHAEEGCEKCHAALMAVSTWIEQMENAERAYFGMRDLGVPAQIARGVLPIDLKTEIVMTANLREWKHVFELRDSPKAHPNMQAIMSRLHADFASVLPEIYLEEVSA